MTHRDHYVRCRGIALTEFVLVLPLAFVLFIGILDFGRVFYTAMTVSHAARAGVQYGAQDNIKSGDFPGMEQAARTAAGDVTPLPTMTAGRYCLCKDGTGSCGCTPGTDGCSTGSGCLASCPSDAPRVYVCVKADKVFTTLFPYPGVPHTTHLVRTAIMRAQ